MSWSGTVTCSYCYKQGHNRRKCPDLTARYKRDYATHMQAMADARDNSTEHYQKMSDEDREWYVKYYGEKAEQARQAYLKRTKIDLATGKKVTNKAAKAARMKNVTCSYCGERGHTRRVCKDLKNDQAIFRRLTIDARRSFVENLAALQVGVGSMVVRNCYGPTDSGEYGYRKVVGMVTGINLHNELNGTVEAMLGRSDVIIAKTNKEMAGARADWRFNFGDLNAKIVTQSRDQGFEVSGWQVTPSGSAPNVPDDFYDPSTVDVKTQFPTGQQRPWEYKWEESEDSIVVRIRTEMDLPRQAYSK